MSLDALTPAVVLGLALLFVYWVWLWAFFTHVRPRIMAGLGRRLEVRVAESTEFLDAGTYNVESPRASATQHGAVWFADIALTVTGTVGAAAVLFVPAFMVADSGALLALETRLTGRGVALESIAPATMSAALPRTTVRVVARNTGTKTLGSCQVRVADYRASNGYLNGQSSFFPLSPGEARAVDLPLSAMRPPPGEHAYAIKTECANERLAQVPATLIVTAP